MPRCITCKKDKPASAFYSKRKEAGGKPYRSSNCKACDVERVTVRLQNLRAQLVELGGGECVQCGYNSCVWALEFHHRRAGAKEFHINRIRSITPAVRREIKKCDLLCANCHRETHHASHEDRQRVTMTIYVLPSTAATIKAGVGDQPHNNTSGKLIDSRFNLPPKV